MSLALALAACGKSPELVVHNGGATGTGAVIGSGGAIASGGTIGAGGAQGLGGTIGAGDAIGVGGAIVGGAAGGLVDAGPIVADTGGTLADAAGASSADSSLSADSPPPGGAGGGVPTGGSGGGGGISIAGSGGAGASRSILDFVPPDNAVSGWIVDRERNANVNGQPMTATTREGVVSLIDGGAEPFFMAPYTPAEFAWQNYLNPTLAQPEGAHLSLYVLRMPSVEQAAGLYSALLQSSEYSRKAGTPEDWRPTSPTIGAESRIQDSGNQWWVNFHQDVFYVEVMLEPSTGPAPDYAPGNAVTKAEAIRFARAVSTAIGAWPVGPGTGGSGGSGGGPVTVDPPLVTFGTVDAGSASLPQTVTVTVTGAATSLNPAVTGAGFSIAGSTCVTPQPAGTCTITLVFSPIVVGAASGTLTVGTVQVVLSGMGAAPASFAVSPNRIDLGNLVEGATAPATVTIAPTGTLTSLACVASGADLALTSQTCPNSGPVSASCSYTFTFKASTAGQKSDAIVCTGGGKTTQTSVVANVVSPAALAISPATGTFSAAVGQSTVVTFSVANTGGAQTGALAVGVTGAGFAVSSSACAVPLAPLGVCKIQVTFAPSAAGTVAGTLTVTDATPDSSPVTAILSGVAVAH